MLPTSLKHSLPHSELTFTCHPLPCTQYDLSAALGPASFLSLVTSRVTCGQRFLCDEQAGLVIHARRRDSLSNSPTSRTAASHGRPCVDARQGRSLCVELLGRGHEQNPAFSPLTVSRRFCVHPLFCRDVYSSVKTSERVIAQPLVSMQTFHPRYRPCTLSVSEDYVTLSTHLSFSRRSGPWTCGETFVKHDGFLHLIRGHSLGRRCSADACIPPILDQSVQSCCVPCVLVRPLCLKGAMRWLRALSLSRPSRYIGRHSKISSH